MTNPLAKLAGSVVLAGLLAGCNAILGTEPGEARKDTTPSTEAPTDHEDGGTTNDGRADGGADDRTDGGAPREHPPDVACPRVIWAKGTDDPICRARRTTTIATGVHAPALAIERTRSGRNVIAYTREASADGGPIEIAQFVDPNDVKTTTLGVEGRDAYRAVAIAKAGADHVLLAYHWESARTLSVAELGPKGFVRTPEDIATDLPAAIELDVATNGNGVALVTYFDSVTKTLAVKTKKNASSAWSPRVEIDKDFVLDGPAGSGQVSATLDDVGNAHVAYNKAVNRASSTPYYRASIAGGWTGRHIIEWGGTAGYGIGLGVFQEDRFAAYYAPGSYDKYRRLHFASWSGNTSATPAIIENDIMVDDPLSPNTAVSLAVDDFGWVHLVTAFPVAYDIEVRYTRQAMIDGKLRFITDVVDALPAKKSMSSPRVAIVVDERSRPHIAYHLGSDDVVRYATIYDDE